MRDQVHKAWGRCLRRLLGWTICSDLSTLLKCRRRPLCRQSHRLHLLSLEYVVKESPPQAWDTIAFKEPAQNLLERPKEECFKLRQDFQNKESTGGLLKSHSRISRISRMHAQASSHTHGYSDTPSLSCV